MNTMRFAIFKENNKEFLLPEILTTYDQKQKLIFQSIYHIKNLHQQKLNLQYKFSEDLQTYLQGKALLLDEIPFPIEQIQEHYLNGYLKYNHGIISAHDLKQFHEHYLNRYLKINHGMTTHQNLYHCCRCGNESQHLFASFHCARCNDDCVYCRKCITMGRVSQCTPLITWTGPPTVYKNNIPSLNQLDASSRSVELQFKSHNPSQTQQDPSWHLQGPERKKHILNWHGQLSLGQQKASYAVMNAINANTDLLVWAVCGSGKTEVLFKGIQSALDQNKRICITTPRTDVVLELTPRLKQAFPDTNIIPLYGGSEDRGKTAQLTISTTHQLLRYYRNFDVVIIDEVDAFPYSVDEMLKFAVRKSKKEHSATIYLSATPDQTLQLQAKKRTLSTVTIPARYHRQPLPVPIFKWCGNWQKRMKKQKQLPPNVITWIATHLQQQKQAFLFVPHIETQYKVVQILKQQNSNIEGVHAEDPNRKEKVQAFRGGSIPILVTTTILERGVTVPNTDVAILGAEDDIFTESALVQIAGRVGRSPKYPTGEVIFYHYGKTHAMNAARNQIVTMNQKGQKLGLVD